MEEKTGGNSSDKSELLRRTTEICWKMVGRECKGGRERSKTDIVVEMALERADLYLTGLAFAPLGDSVDSGLDGIKEKARAERTRRRVLPAALPEPFDQAGVDGVVLRTGSLRGRVYRG